ncbi:hypothetical protein GIY30_02085 [Gordonia sp. HNM0687]|uniref:DUF3105 domain-containing protein n=1 Tax=Gordonia mangrovi TaxID=2665643 RepID=A0A6L7GJM7_9ACTN|nr:hypothetical protein [Gordonia mangrovi]MXP20160.1 hypothetical protein [Gordonia mangrovi]UVF79233.1 hypothetical protein NWF22_05155 [Gordonia mangrovi]
MLPSSDGGDDPAESGTPRTSSRIVVIAVCIFLTAGLLVAGWLLVVRSSSEPAASNVHDNTPSDAMKRGGIRTSDMAGMSVAELFSLIRYEPSTGSSDYVIHVLPNTETSAGSLDEQIIGPVCADMESPGVVELWLETYPRISADIAELKRAANADAGIAFTAGLRNRVPECENTVFGVGYDEKAPE